MYIQLDLESKKPIYTQLKHEIIAGIAKNELKPGEALPSVRSLASDLSINLHTVNKAYQQLKQEGFILIHRQKGVVVQPNGVEPVNDQYRNGLQDTLRPLIAESICRSMSESEYLQICHELFKEFTKEKREKE